MDHRFGGIDHMKAPRRSDVLAEGLREQIMSGTISAGQKLPSESALISEHHVSRTVVREALGRLHAEGLITTRRGLGSFALTPPPAHTAASHRPVRSLRDRLDVIDYRLALEPEAAALAARRCSSSQAPDQQLSALIATCHGFASSAENPAQAIQHDFSFHRSIALLSGNPYLSDALDSLGPVMISMPRTRLEGSDSEHGRQRHELAAWEHQQIIDAVVAGDSAGAAAAMRVHLGNSRRRVIGEHGEKS